jgi:drug/metabolite transporter (DMT)-like permease
LLLFDEHLNQWALAGIGLVILSVTVNTVLKRRWEQKPST